MKAAIFNRYGGPEVMTLTDLPRPIPKPNEVLVKVAYSSVTTGDANIRGSVFIPRGFKLLARLMFGLFKPRSPLLGMEFSGEVMEVGSAVTKFKTGDQVFGHMGKKRGAYAEYLVIAETEAISRAPKNFSLEQSAVLSFGGLTALHFVTKLGQIKPGETVLVYGASGCVGTNAVQIAKYYGAHVTAVCSKANFELVKKLGADEVIDYRSEDFTKNGEYYDAIIETKGIYSFSQVKNSLTAGNIKRKNAETGETITKPPGRFLAVAAGPKAMLEILLVSLKLYGGGRKILMGDGGEKQSDLITLRELAEQGALVPVIDRTFLLTDIVEAHRYVDGGHKQGNVLIKIE